ncbi:MAG: hypothetical protein AMXMBFR33_16510 [Candidatus Xenobia bacterium]
MQAAGRSGGVALYLRQLVYEHPGLPMPDARPVRGSPSDLKQDLFERRRRRRAENSKPSGFNPQLIEDNRFVGFHANIDTGGWISDLSAK